MQDNIRQQTTEQLKTELENLREQRRAIERGDFSLQRAVVGTVTTAFSFFGKPYLPECLHGRVGDMVVNAAGDAANMAFDNWNLAQVDERINLIERELNNRSWCNIM